jgi:hypothetical protein
MKSITIKTNTSDKIKDLSAITQRNQQMYASRYGYKWVCEYFEYDTPDFNQNALAELVKLKEHIQSTDVLMVVGADVMFMNHWIRVEDILKPDDKVVVAKERLRWWPINNDVMIYVNTPDTLAFVDRFIKDFHMWNKFQWRQQQHLWNLIQLDPWIRSTVRIVEAEVMNQHPQHWQLGEYILHPYGLSVPNKIEIVKQMEMLFPNYLPLYGGVTDSHMPDVA